MALLAHLYPHIKGSQEDIATLSLQYLLMQSKELNSAFTKRISAIMHTELEDTMQYLCQVVGKDEGKERPDMAGINSQGEEIILFEMKFYASLTENQPLTYLDRLSLNRGKGLVFICPTARRTNLWAKLEDYCKDREIEHIDNGCIKVNGIILAITTWAEIIELLEQTTASVAIAYSSDVVQLKAYCNMIDDEAFIPFSAEDLSAGMASKCERYYQIVDEVIELLLADKTIVTSKDGLKAAGYRRGYTRSLHIDDMTITINYDRYMWKNSKSVETPFWIAFRDSRWHQDEKIKEKLTLFPDHKKDNFWDMIYLALEPLQNATLSEVCEDLKNKILEYYTTISK